jgi:hypothetical protein
MRAGWFAAVAARLGACTTIKLNHDNTNTITYRGGPEVGLELATRACRKAGETSAIIISTMNKDPSLPPGKGRQVSIFRCTSAEPHPTSQ